ncbi:MAG: DGQHR domain-containing protein [Candidatus Jordarchaeaceae archaeon]
MKSKDDESASHRELKNKLKKIMERCKLEADREVHLNISGKKNNEGKYEDEMSVDVLVKFSYKGKNCMIFFECKDQREFKSIRKELTAWRNNISEILQDKKNVKVLNSSDKKVVSKDFEEIDEIKLCFVFSEKLEQKKYDEHQKILNQFSFMGWNYRALKYYDKISQILEGWTRYEIFRELQFFFESRDTHREEAIKIKQPGFPEMYFLGLHPGLLLKIGYVSRRTSQKPLAYQRMLNKERIKRISEFLASDNILLPNVIILAFDNDSRIQNGIKYEKNTLEFPIIYCSAWIIDGQHRVFGFLNTRYKDWDMERNEEFKIPVVVFKTLDEVTQNKTFVNINYYQKKIDPTLLCELVTVTQDLKNELTWPSLLTTELNKTEPLKDYVKISELDTGKPITLSGFSRYGLLETLLGFKKRTGKYEGPLFKYAPFDPNLEFRDERNQIAFKKQRDLLIRFFKAVKSNTQNRDSTKDPWINLKDYSLLKTTGINALLFVLARLLGEYPRLNIDLENYLRPLKNINFGRDYVSSKGTGWKGFRNFANEIIDKLNQENNGTIRKFREKEKI